MKNNIKDTISNWVGQIKAFINYSTSGGKPINPPAGYQLKFSDDFNKPLNIVNWRRSHIWGNFHPGNLSQHYDLVGYESYVTPEEGLALELRWRPLDVVKSDLPDWRQTPDLPERFTIPNAVGLVCSRKSWQWGWFSADIKLPTGRALWPAFWLTGENSWPPEIDILEAYSKLSKDYTDRFFFKKRPWVSIQPNIHWGVVEEGSKRMWGAYNVPVWRATERWVQYACHWEKDFIRIYYDGVKVFEVTDKRVLEWFNREGAEQFIVLNNGVDDIGTQPTESVMLVKNVRVYQK